MLLLVGTGGGDSVTESPTGVVDHNRATGPPTTTPYRSTTPHLATPIATSPATPLATPLTTRPRQETSTMRTTTTTTTTRPTPTPPSRFTTATATTTTTTTTTITTTTTTPAPTTTDSGEEMETSTLPGTTVELPTGYASLEVNQCEEIGGGGACAQVDGYLCVPDDVTNVTLVCRLDSDGWLVWLRRVDDGVSFNRTWDEYVAGFGDREGNYWLGLEALHLVTGRGVSHDLGVELGAWSGEGEWAEYLDFSVMGSHVNYTLLLNGSYTGNISNDAMGFNNGRPFSTYDWDMDGWMNISCSGERAGGGGWWYNNCSQTYPTGVYGGEGERGRPYMWWDKAFNAGNQTLRYLTMKTRPRQS